MALDRLRATLLGLCPEAMPRAVVRASRIAAVAAIPAMILLVVSPLIAHPWTLGEHDWEQMNSQLEVVAKSILRFHQFPFWDPYTCGGHSAWGSLESAPVAVSPWLPAYLLLPLPLAIRIQIVGSAIVGAVGWWFFASRFTRSVALRALVVILVAVNSRWSLQLATGHIWHLLYGLVPWILYLFDRAIDIGTPPQRARWDLALAAACIAVMVYGDAIYPVPHTAFLLVVYAAFLAVSSRSWSPIRALAILGALSLGLAGPKLFPLLEQLRRYPRHITSEEAIWPQNLLKIVTWRIGDLRATTSFTTGMWHEWGLYLGWAGVALLVTGLVASRGPRERALKWAAFVMILFVIGGFHPLAPWRLVHLLPIFNSQHVPSRWFYPAVAILVCAAASGGERLLVRAQEKRAFFEVVLGFAAVLVALDMGLVARMPLAESFATPAPSFEDEVTPFRMVHRLPPQESYPPRLWDVATLPGVFANVGTLECNTYAGLHAIHRDEEGRMPGLGAWGEDDAEYRGEAYVAEGDGTAKITAWTPNAVEVRVDGAHVGDRVILNQNWDPGWLADGAPALAYRDAVSAPLRESSQTVRFRYWPRSLGPALALFGLTVASIALWLRRGRRADGARS